MVWHEAVYIYICVRFQLEAWVEWCVSCTWIGKLTRYDAKEEINPTHPE